MCKASEKAKHSMSLTSSILLIQRSFYSYRGQKQSPATEVMSENSNFKDEAMRYTLTQSVYAV